MNKLKKFSYLQKYFLIFILSAVSILCGIFCTRNDNLSRVLADNTNAYNLTVQKVNRYKYDSNYALPNFDELVSLDYNHDSTVDYQYKVVNDINNGDFVLLNNAELESENFSEHTNYDTTENVMISFKSNEGYIVNWLTVEATLNDSIRLDCGPSIKDSNNNFTYNIFLDLNNLKDIELNSIDNLEGKYTFKFSYVYKIGSTVSNPYEKTFSFYLINEDTYLNKNYTGSDYDKTNRINISDATVSESDYILSSVYNNNNSDNADYSEPRIFNTEKIDRFNYNTKSLFTNEKYKGDNAYRDISKNEFNFFNFNNNNTVDYYGKLSSNDNTLLYPTLKYNALKYNMSYTKSVSGKTTIFTSEIIEENSVYKVKLYSQTSSTSLKTLVATYELENEICTIQFSQIGQYDFDFNFLYKHYTGEFEIINTPSFVLNKEYLIGDVKLDIFGYQMFYTKYDEATKQNVASEYKNENYNADFTYYNKINLENIINLTQDENEENDTNEIYLIDDAKIPSTNQAPVFTTYLASIYLKGSENKNYSYYRYYANGIGTELTGIFDYTNATRFTQNGYYELVIYYNYTSYKNLVANVMHDAINSVHAQVFAFSIKNKPPVVQIKTEDNVLLNSGDFTNKNVNIDISSETSGNPFDVNPVINYQYRPFGTTNWITYSNSTITSLTDSYHYRILVYYGPYTSNSTIPSSRAVYTFTIDKDSINNPVVRTATNENNVFVVKDNIDTLNTNSSFALDYTLTKNSGAKISVKYAFAPLEEIVDFDTYIVNNNLNYLANGYRISNIYDNTPYIKTNSINDILSKQGLYLFTLKDEAGNIATKFIIVDSTTPVMIKHVTGYDNEGEYRLANMEDYVSTNDTNIIWGTHKLIELSNNVKNLIEKAKTDLTNYANVLPSQTLNASISELNNSFYENDVVFDYYKSSIKNVVIEDANANVLLNINDFSTPSINTKNNQIFEAHSSDSVFSGGEKVYNIACSDYVKSIGSIANISSKNSTKTQVYIMTDKSAMFAYSYSETDDLAKKYTALFDNSVYPTRSVTNRDTLFVTFNNVIDDDYEIESLIVKYYPFSLSRTDANYPFSDNAETFDILSSAVTHNARDGLNAINNLISVALNTSAGKTRAGKYVIERTYKGDIGNASTTGDSKVRYYTYIVDRNEIIKQFETYTIGGGISLDMGNKNSTYSFSQIVGLQFLVDLAEGQNIVSTNLLPSKVNTPTYKYFMDYMANNSEEFNSALGLNIIIEKQNINGVPEIIYSSSSISEHIINKIFDISNYTEQGIYKVTITDNAGYQNGNQNNCESNMFSFTYEIKHNAPDGNYFREENNEYIELITKSTNYDEIFFIWDNPLSQYHAKVNGSKVTATHTSTDGTITRLFSGEILSDFESIIDGNKIKLDLSALGIKKEGVVTVHLEYEGDKDDYTALNAEQVLTNYFSADFEIIIDTTPPNYNLNRLLSLDNYLIQTQMSDSMRESIMNKNRTQNMNFENYVFVISPEFNFEKSNDEKFFLDTNDIYYRQYNKYSVSETNGTHLQSIVPGDAYFNSLQNAPITYRFDPNLENIYESGSGYSHSLRLFSNNYYEIIEIDEAGNHTIYSVYVSDVYNPTFVVDYTIDSIVYSVNEFSENNALESNTSEQLSLTNINSKVKFYNVEIKDNNSQEEKVVLKMVNKNDNLLLENEFNNETNLIEAINQLILMKTEYDKIGNSFTITFVYQNEKFSIKYNTPGAIADPTFNDYPSYFTVNIFNSASTYIKDIKAFQIKIDSSDNLLKTQEVLLNQGIDYTLKNDAITDVMKQFIATESATGAYYLFTFTDNFGRTKVIPHFSHSAKNVKEIDYQGNIENINGVVYTAKDFSIKYQSNLYNVVIQKLNIETNEYEDITDSIISETANTGVKTYRNVATGVIDTDIEVKYRVSFTVPMDNIDNQDLINEVQNQLASTTDITLYTHVPNVTLYDNANNRLDILGDRVDNGGSTSKICYISYSDIDEIFPISVTLERVYKNEAGDVMTETIYDVPTNYIIDKNGDFRIVISNTLGANKQFCFKKKDDIATFYSVYTTGGVNAKKLSPINSFYEFRREVNGEDNVFQIEHYISNDINKESYIELNPNRNLTYQCIQQLTNRQDNTEVYRIYTNSSNILYEQFIAITYVNNDTNILKSSFKLSYIDENNEEQSEPLSGTTEKQTTLKKLKLSWNSYYSATFNDIYVNYYLNGVFVGKLDKYSKNVVLTQDDTSSTLSIELTDAGLYNFYFYDLAGNVQQFTSGTTNLNYYSVYVLNEVIFTINGQNPIDNAIYNSPVTMQIQQINSYDLGRVSYSYKHNSKTVILTSNIYNYEFSHEGVHELTIMAKVYGEDISSTIKFTILNPNIARYGFEYTGYTIKSVKQNNTELVDTLRGEEPVLSTLVLSADNSTGKFTVTIVANYSGLRPTQQFSFDVWINDDEPIIRSSVAEGDKTIKNIILTFNPYLIYNQIGESSINFISADDGHIYDAYVIDETNSVINEIVQITISQNDSYIVQLKSLSGNTISSFRVTKHAPLNTVAIIIISLASAVVIVAVVLFIKYRTKIKVK